MKKEPKGEVFQSTHTNLFYWQKRTSNGRIAAIGGKGFRRADEAETAGGREFPGLRFVRLGVRSFAIPR